jgi:hypothetical protein
MAFPAKFRHLIERTAAEVEKPDYVWLSYAVCAVTAEACGWEGWTIEAAFRRDGKKHPTGTGDRLVRAADEQICPRCGRQTFRTEVELRVEPSADQSPPHGRAGIDYEVVPIEYEE